MTGLFGALIGSARGTAPVILQRPRQHFAPFEAAAPPLEVVEEAQADQSAPFRGPPPEIRGESQVPAARIDGKLPSASPRGSEPVGAKEPGVRTGQGARPLLPAAEREPVVPPPPAERPAATGPHPSRAEAEPRSGREPAGPAGPAEAAEPVASREVKLLLPELARPAMPDPANEADGFGRPLFDPEPSPREESDSKHPRVALTIGRIEVNAPKTRLAAPPAARAVIVPRAKPRQTLDDYLSRRRR